ncbi:MAG: hypothetical protein KIT60_19885 [Burkholderiaceae bacterium]|nr:hypothetical protein [Burkholderiaceae bacterium]
MARVVCSSSAPDDKRGSGYRLYGPADVDRLKQTKQCGFTLSEIDALLRLR